VEVSLIPADVNPSWSVEEARFAVRVGFEPTVGVAYNGFQDRHLRPLGHRTWTTSGRLLYAKQVDGLEPNRELLTRRLGGTMKLFRGRRRAKKIDQELGKGLWRQAHDRYVRGLDRYHQILDGVEDDAVYNQLVLIGDQLAEQLPRVYELCCRGQKEFPATEMQIPQGAHALHSGLSRAANHVATTAEAEAMVRLSNGQLDSVRHRASQVLDCLSDAESTFN
jgi:hypothetical protein